MIFVFGSNEAGRHGGGAARAAHINHGARYGFSYGHVGNSFAIPTKDQTIEKTLSLTKIDKYVQGFLAYADGHPEWEFQVTRIGCGLAGLHDAQVSQMFFTHPENCLFDHAWHPYLPSKTRFWGTF